MSDETVRRKDAHLDLCREPEVEPETAIGNGFDSVQLVHSALPELNESEIDLTVRFLGRELRAPILITGMTGGTPRAGEVNRAVAGAAQRAGIAFGVGSQRAMLERPELIETFQVRSVAPEVPLLGNIGLAQAIASDPKRIRGLAEAIGADGLALHLNAAQEMAQPEGDRNFRGGYDAIGRLLEVFGDRLVVKETGCGISPRIVQRLVSMGVRIVDVSGSGGTSWVKVELMRGGRPGVESFESWGIPTAAAVAGSARKVGDRATLIASGGIRDGLQAAKAIALGAHMVGVALPMFRAQQSGGAEEAAQFVQSLVTGLRTAMLLTGCRTLAELRRSPTVVLQLLRPWMEALE